MSYILEALKRAEAERGRVTDAAQPQQDTDRPRAADVRGGVRALQAGWWIAMAVALACLGAWLAWMAIAGLAKSTDHPPPTTPLTNNPPPLQEMKTAAVAVPATDPAPILMPQHAPQRNAPLRPAASLAATAERGTSEGATSILVPSSSENPTVKTRPVPALALSIEPPPPRTTTAPSVTPASGSVAVSSPASSPVPALQVTGVTYSDNPAHRMLIINGKVVLEGQDIEAGLTLEAITPRSAVVNQRGNRFNINY